MVEVSVAQRGTYARDGAPPVTVGSDAEPWLSALRFELVDVSGAVVMALPFHPTKQVPSRAVLPYRSGGVSVSFALSEADSARLPVGTYQVRVKLDLRADPQPDTWHGSTADSRPLTIFDEGAAPTSAVSAEGAVARGIYRRAIGEPEGALAAFEQALSFVPDHLWATSEHASQLLTMKRYVEAHREFSRAIDLSNALKPNASEPRLDLLEGLQAAFEGIQGDVSP